MTTLARTLTGALAVALAVVLLAGCTSRDGKPGAAAGSKEDPYAGDALRYGMAPVPHPSVTFQPDVVIVKGGGKAVRSVAADGFTWYLDPQADNADQLKPGKIMFVTGRGVGRVLHVARDGADLAVTIGPAGLTEVIRDGEFATTVPVSLNDTLVHDAGEPFWSDADLSNGSSPRRPVPSWARSDAPPIVGAGGQTRRDNAAPPPRRPPQPTPVRGGTATGKIGSTTLTPFCCASGIGAEVYYDDGGIRFRGKVTFKLSQPTAGFELSIRGGRVTQAELVIDGAGGLEIDLEAATAVGNTRNVHRRLLIPINFSIPLGVIGGVPFSVTTENWVEVRTVFTAKDSSIKASGEYSFGGRLGFGYNNGRWGARTPTGFKVTDSLIESISGLSVGVQRMQIAYSAKFSLGFGLPGFFAGVYFGLTATVWFTLGSSAGVGLAVCRGAALTIHANYGIGYTIAEPIEKLVNEFLSLFDAGPIKLGGHFGSETKIFQRSQVIPSDTKVCG